MKALHTCILVALCAPSTQSHYVRRAQSPPWEESEIARGFGTDPEYSNLPAPSLGNEQGIRNGFDSPPLPWFAVFQGGTLCGGSLIHGDM